MYESPIKEIYEDIVDGIRIQHDNGIIRAVQKIGISVDKEELRKALAYDRNQYEKGYTEAIEDAIKTINMNAIWINGDPYPHDCCAQLIDELTPEP